VNPIDHAAQLRAEIRDGEAAKANLQHQKKAADIKGDKDAVYLIQAQVNDLSDDLAYLRGERNETLARVWVQANNIILPEHEETEMTKAIREKLRALYDSPDVAEVA
jgi:hypothetical protein